VASNEKGKIVTFLFFQGLLIAKWISKDHRKALIRKIKRHNPVSKLTDIKLSHK